MTEKNPFIQAILADPNADSARLALADWLHEHGDPRGEFIRVQCRLAATNEQDPDYPHLKEREETLLATQRRALLGSLANLNLDVRFERGLPASVTLTAPLFLDHADVIFACAPIHEVCLKQLTGLVERLAACPHLARVARLWLTFNQLDAAAIRTLAGSPYLQRLTTLNLGHNRIGNEGLIALAHASGMPRLEHLWVSSNDIGDLGVQKLAIAPLLAQLRTLRLNSNPIGDSGVQALAASPNVAYLEGLHLGGSRCGDNGALALAASPHLQALRWLILKKCPLGEAAERALRQRFGSGFNRENLD